MNFVHKTELVPREKGLDLDWEYKFKYERADHSASFLGTGKKGEVEMEYEPQGLKTADSFLRFKLKETINPNPRPEEDPEKRFCPYMKYWNINSELESKFMFAKDLTHTLKFTHDWKSYIPKAKFTTLFNKKPFLMGLTYNFDYTAPKATGPIEVMIGGNPYKNITAYLKNEVNEFQYPGKFTIGVYNKQKYECTCDKKTKKGVVSKTSESPIEYGAEASIDLMAKEKKLLAKTGLKTTWDNKYTAQLMYDSDFKLSSAFSYVPKKGFKLMWSDQVDTKKLVTDPKGGIGYLYGFTLEFNL